MFRKKKECEHVVSQGDLMMAVGAAIFAVIKAITTYQAYSRDRADSEIHIIYKEGHK